ncbi:isopentenyl-diphosphate Delta-isomerase [Rhodococcus phenolicus]|uniref:isopentenyl-diphosphate Delta-isomerase n=1 Tax=Rhodococcus phenolicus TaxID=263849 RepID=UPI00082B8970|nr:isopentenyl-diphosphate Delta-isomerase [Rhodococcus phenolicus]
MEHVVLLDEAGRAVGTEPKATVHTTETPLHLAFSAYVFDRHGGLLITRRALDKATWPGIWTNSCCGHPGPDEPLGEAVRRRLHHELGIDSSDVDLVLPDFRYHAVMDSGLVENEICPVFRVRYDGPRPVPHPQEVDDLEWIDWPTFSEGVDSGIRTVSPWCREQVRQLRRLGPVPADWPVAPMAALPPAAKDIRDLPTSRDRCHGQA